VNHSISQTATYFFNSLLGASHGTNSGTHGPNPMVRIRHSRDLAETPDD